MTAVTEREDEAYFLEPATIPGDAESEAGIVYEEVHIDDDEALIQYEGFYSSHRKENMVFEMQKNSTKKLFE